MESFFIGRRISTLKGTAWYPNKKKNDTKEHDERADLQSCKLQSQGGKSATQFISTCAPSSHALSTYEIRPNGHENRYHYKIHPRKNWWLQNEPVHPWLFKPKMDPKLNKSHHCATRCMDQVFYVLNYCYHYKTHGAPSATWFLHVLLATLKNCPNPFYMTCVHPFCRGNWGEPRIRGGENHANTAPFCAKERKRATVQTRGSEVTVVLALPWSWRSHRRERRLAIWKC